jgi:hypothetical protein
MPLDFTVIFNVRQHFGDQGEYFNYEFDYAGNEHDYQFDCPNVDTGAEAVLMFQSRDVDNDKNVLQINPATAPQPSVFGGIPVGPGGKNTWNGNIMLIRPNVLRATGNQLHIASRNTQGTTGHDMDDFVLDNVVVLYKTRVIATIPSSGPRRRKASIARRSKSSKRR